MAAHYGLGLAIAKLATSETATAAAIDAFSKAITINGTFADAYYQRGEAFYTLKQYHEAALNLSKPEITFYLAGLGVAHKAGEVRKA